MSCRPDPDARIFYRSQFSSPKIQEIIYREPPKVFRYALVHDTGFAPCFDYGVCTLACCKPRVRCSAKIGDWIIGLQSATKAAAHLLYAMRVGRILSFAEYFSESSYASRIDNIYKPMGKNEFQWVGHKNHCVLKNQIDDYSCQNVLIADWWYRNTFGFDLLKALGTERAMRFWYPYIGHKTSGLIAGDLEALLEKLLEDAAYIQDNGAGYKETSENIIVYCQKKDRVCPVPGKWNELWEMLPNKKRDKDTWEPAMPLILGAWYDTPADAKTLCLITHIKWAEDHGELEKVSAFLKGLREDEWYHNNDLVK